MDKRIELYKKNLKEKKYLLNENLEYLSEGIQGKVFRIRKLGVIVKKINYEHHKEWIPILNKKNVLEVFERIYLKKKYIRFFDNEKLLDELIGEVLFGYSEIK